MSFGSDVEGGAAEGVGGSSFGGPPSGGGGTDYGFTGMGTTPGLNVGYDTSPGYGFKSGTDAGFNAGGYDLGGGLGSSLGYGYGEGYAPTADYGLSWGMPAAYDDASGIGLQATPTAPGAPGLGYGSTTTPFSAKEEPGFWGSRAQKVMSFLANLNPVTSLLNAGLAAINSNDPVRAGIQGLVGRFGGPMGQMANMGYNVATARDPTAAGLGVLGGYVGGQIGGGLAGQVGANLGSSTLGGLAAAAGATNQGYGPYGSGSAAADAMGRMGAGASVAGGGPTEGGSGGGGSERNWTDTAMSLASGIYGMRQANAQRALAMEAAAPSRAAGVELQRVISGDFTNDPGFKAAQLSAARAGSQQPGGFAAQAAAQAALKYQNDRIAVLSGASGSNQGYANALAGTQQGINTSMAGVAELARGVTGNSAGLGAVPPWLQSWLLKNGMGA
jgi:hypothetical protein